MYVSNPGTYSHMFCKGIGAICQRKCSLIRKTCQRDLSKKASPNSEKSFFPTTVRKIYSDPSASGEAGIGSKTCQGYQNPQMLKFHKSAIHILDSTSAD